MLAVVQDNELDRGAKSAAATERTCALTRAVLPVDAMLRFVVSPGGEAVPDLKRKLPGRGLWITATRASLDEAVQRKVFARGFKRDVRVAADLAAQTERLLERSALDALAIAGKSGLVAAGFAKAEAAIAHDDIVGLIHAADAGADGVAKLDGALRRRPDGEKIPIVTTFTTGQLDLALGRSNVVHAALLAGPANDTFLARMARLGRFRSGKTDESGQGRARN